MIEAVFDKLIRVPAVTAKVAQRIALTELPQNTGYPAVVYDLISHNPEPNLNYAAEPIAMARFQVTAIGKTIAVVKSVQQAIRGALDFTHNAEVDGVRVVSIRLDEFGPVDRDDEAGLWTQSADYIVRFYES